jgi:hypothetical protein
MENVVRTERAKFRQGGCRCVCLATWWVGLFGSDNERTKERQYERNKLPGAENRGSTGNKEITMTQTAEVLREDSNNLASPEREVGDLVFLDPLC